MYSIIRKATVSATCNMVAEVVPRCRRPEDSQTWKSQRGRARKEPAGKSPTKMFRPQSVMPIQGSESRDSKWHGTVCCRGSRQLEDGGSTDLQTLGLSRSGRLDQNEKVRFVLFPTRSGKGIWMSTRGHKVPEPSRGDLCLSACCNPGQVSDKSWCGTRSHGGSAVLQWIKEPGSESKMWTTSWGMAWRVMPHQRSGGPQVGIKVAMDSRSRT